MCHIQNTRIKNIMFTKKGKKIIMCSQNSDQHHIRTIFGYGMEGRLIYEETKHTGVRFDFGRVESQSDGIDLVIVEHELWFHDSRHFGHINTTTTQTEYDFVMKDVGPDLLDGEVSYDVFREIVNRKNVGRMRLAEFLLKQKYMSGVGNYIRAESLYRAKLSPYRLLSSLNETDQIMLYNGVIETIFEAYSCGGLTIHTYISPDNTEGTYKCRVYEQSVDSLKNPVEKFKDKEGRTVHWVPAVQV